MKIYIPIAALLLVSACQNPGRVTGAEAGGEVTFQRAPSEAFKDYWYRGEAELSSYTLSQNRYRDNHPGEAVLIFVTEDFLTDKQVKDEGEGGGTSTSVLKTNMIRRFSTGLYDYSIMSSVFTPVEGATYPHTLKVTHSSQDWCGQTFMQVNQARDQYRVRVYSYFQREGDQDFTAPAVPMEDELFNRVRLDPESLPTGELRMFPSATYCRLNHLPFDPQDAVADLRDYSGKDFEMNGLREYRVVFPKINRTLSIVFHQQFPYRIEGWSETYPSLDGQERTTLAQRRETLIQPYWALNNRSDMALRDSLAINGL